MYVDEVPLSVDLDATIDESCAEVLSPWVPLGEDEFLELEVQDLGSGSLAEHAMKLRAFRVVGDVSRVVPAEHLRRVLALPALAEVEVLMLPVCNLGKEGGDALSAAVLPKLRLLDVRKTAIGDVGARALASSSLGARLEHLSIAGAYLTVDGLQVLLDSPMGKRIRSLHVEEEGQSESIIPTLMERLYRLGKGDDTAVARAFARLLEHPALTQESRDEFRYQWDLIISS